MATITVNLKPTKVPSRRTSAVDSEVACKVIQCFQKGEARSQFTDFVVIVDNIKFPCHRFVLSSCSGFFEALLRCDMREKNERQATVIGIEPAIFELVLGAMYGRLNALTEVNMLNVWHAAHQLQIEFLMEICENFIFKSITVNNFWDIYVDAECLDSDKIMKAVKTFMIQNFFQVAQSNEFMKVYFENLLDILRNEKLPVCTDFIVESVLKWTGVKFERHNSAQTKLEKKERAQMKDTDVIVGYRKENIDQLLQAVRLQNASKDCLAMLMTNEDILGNRDAIREVNKHVAKDYVAGKKWKKQQQSVTNYNANYYPPQFQRFEPVAESFETSDVKNCPHCGTKKSRLLALPYYEESDWS